MSKQITETKRKSYPFIGFRPTKQQAARIRRVSRMLKRAKQPCGVSVVIRACVDGHLPLMETNLCGRAYEA